MRTPSLRTLRELASRHRWKLAGAAGVWVVWLLFGWLALPGIVKPRLERAISEATGHPTTLGALEIDPLWLAVTLHDLRIATPDGETVVSAKRVFVDFETRSLIDRAWTFKALDIDEPYLNAVLRADGALNLGDLAGPPLPVSTAPEPADPAPTALPRVIVQSFAFRGGKVDWHDLGLTPPLATSFPNLSLSLTDFSTLPDDRGEYALQASGPTGGLLVWRGNLGVNPLASVGRFTLEGVDLPTGFDLVEQRFAYDVTAGTLRGTIDYALADAPDGIAFAVTDAALTVERFALGPRGGAPLVTLPTLAVTGVEVDVPKRRVHVAEVRLDQLGLTLGRDAGGIDLVELLTAPPPVDATIPAASSDGTIAPAADPATPTTPASTTAVAPPAEIAPAKPGRPWRIALDRFALVGASVALTDRTLAEPGTVTVAPLEFSLTDVALGTETRFTVALDAVVNGAGRVSLKGPLAGADPAGTLALKVEGLALAPFQPWIRPLARVELTSGALGVDAQFTLAPNAGPRDAKQRLKGYAEIADLKVRDDHLKQDLLRWKRLQLQGLDVALAPQRIRIEEIVAEQPYLRFIVGADGTTNLAGLSTAAPATPAPKAGPKPAAATLPVEVKRVRVLDGSANFADQSLTPAFATGIQQLNGSIVGLSSQEAKRAEIVLDGKVDRYAPVAIRGKVNLLAAESYSDVTMSFHDIELTTFTPYSGKFAGYKIDKGRLSLDIHYLLEDRHIKGDHKVVLDQLTLGEQVDSADAMSLPIKLALALLKDSRGVIDLDLPVEGDLDDPQFRYGPIVWKAVLSVFTKIVTAPFAALGSLFGGGDDLSTLAFAPGSAALDAVAIGRLDTLAKGLAARPALRLDVRGVAAPGADGARLARLRVLATVRPDGSASELVALTPKEQKALLAIHAQRFGADPKVDGLAEGAKPTPVQLQEAALAALANADGPPPDALRALAQARAAAVKDYLVNRGLVPAGRVFLLEADDAAAIAADGPVTMTLALSAE